MRRYGMHMGASGRKTSGIVFHGTRQVGTK